MGKRRLQRISVFVFYPSEYGYRVFEAYSGKIAGGVEHVFRFRLYEVEAGEVRGGENFRPILDFGIAGSVLGKRQLIIFGVEALSGGV